MDTLNNFQQINTNRALIFRLQNQINDISGSTIDLSNNILDLSNNKYNKTGGLISGDVEISGNLTFTNEDGARITTQGFLSVVSPTGGGSALELKDEVEDIQLRVEASPGNTGLFTNDTLLFQSKNVGITVEEGNYRMDSQTSRMVMSLGENVDGSNLGLVADISGSEIGSNNKLTIQADGDLTLKNQTDREGKISIQSNGIIELKEMTGNIPSTIRQVDNKGNYVSHTVSSNIVDIPYVDYRVEPLLESGDVPNNYSIGIGIDDLPQLFLSRNEADITENDVRICCAGGKVRIGDVENVNNTHIEINDSNQTISSFTPIFRQVALNGGYVQHLITSNTNTSFTGYVIQPCLDGGVNPDNYELFIGNEDEPQVVIRKNEDYTLNDLTLSCAGGKVFLGDNDVYNSTRIEVDDPSQNIILNTENLTFTGAGLQSDSAGGISGEHLVITLNGVQYKIKLIEDNLPMIELYYKLETTIGVPFVDTLNFQVQDPSAEYNGITTTCLTTDLWVPKENTTVMFVGHRINPIITGTFTGTPYDERFTITDEDDDEISCAKVYQDAGTEFATTLLSVSYNVIYATGKYKYRKIATIFFDNDGTIFSGGQTFARRIEIT